MSKYHRQAQFFCRFLKEQNCFAQFFFVLKRWQAIPVDKRKRILHIDGESSPFLAENFAQLLERCRGGNIINNAFLWAWSEQFPVTRKIKWVEVAEQERRIFQKFRQKLKNPRAKFVFLK